MLHIFYSMAYVTTGVWNQIRMNEHSYKSDVTESIINVNYIHMTASHIKWCQFRNYFQFISGFFCRLHGAPVSEHGNEIRVKVLELEGWSQNNVFITVNYVNFLITNKTSIGCNFWFPRFEYRLWAIRFIFFCNLIFIRN